MVFGILKHKNKQKRSNSVIMQSKPVLVSLLLILTQGNGELFDFHVISRRQSFHAGEILCQNLGYDGLAVINSPEMFAYALRISRTVR